MNGYVHSKRKLDSNSTIRLLTFLLPKAPEYKGHLC